MISAKVLFLVSLGLLASLFIATVASDPVDPTVNNPLTDAFKLQPRGLLREEDLGKAQEFLDKSPGVQKLFEDNGIKLTDFIKVPADVVVKTSNDAVEASDPAVESSDKHEKKKRGAKRAKRV